MLRAAFAALCTAAALGASLPAAAQQSPFTRAEVQRRAQRVDELFNWYYAAVFGTGYYRVGEERVAVVRVPLSYELQPAGVGQWGWRLTLPVSLALAEFDLSDFHLDKVRAQGLTLLPGIEGEYRFAPDWTLRPFANLGAGWEFGRDGSSTIFTLGATTRHTQPVGKDSRLALGAKLAYAGYSAGSEASQLLLASLGGELAVPAGFSLYERAALVAFQLTGTMYFQELEFLLPATGTMKVSREVEVGLALGVWQPLEILGVQFDRVGLAYRAGDNGLRGVRLLASFPF